MGELSASQRRAQALASVEALTWDLVVIGGGISGAGVAQQAARRGWSVLLVEQRDFAWGSSSRSSKLVHGGLRYLKQGDLKTTLHSVRQRDKLMREAPELVEPQSFLLAHCQGRAPGRWLFQLGLTVYDAMAGQRSHFWVPAPDAQRLAPGLAPVGLRGALVFQDAKTDDARLVWRVLMEAQSHGAVLLNYVTAQAPPQRSGAVSRLSLRDAITGQAYAVQTKAVVNATGAWADTLRVGAAAKAMLRPLRGSHLVVPFWRLPVAQSISLMHPQDGRPVFFYPWEGATLIGTTDLDHCGDLNQEPGITPREVDYLLAAVNDQYPMVKLRATDVSACYAGVRPVIDDGQVSASKATRDHVVLDEAGLITLTGGKLTTFGRMAQDALVLAAPYAGRSFHREDAALLSPVGALNPRWSAAVRHRLAGRYGHLVAQLTAQAEAADLQWVPGTQTLWLELALAARHEAVIHLDDLLLRRTRLGIVLARGGLDHEQRIRALCEPHLRWGPARWAAELKRYRALVAAHYALPGADKDDA